MNIKRYGANISVQRSRRSACAETQAKQSLQCPPEHDHENMPISFLPPLKPNFYIVKLGLTRVYIIFLISAQNIDCGYSLEPPRRGGSNEYPQSMF